MGFWKTLFHCRIPIATLFVILILALASEKTTAIEGVFAQDGWSGVLLSCFATLMLSFACVCTINLTREHGPERFYNRVYPAGTPPYSPPWWIFWLGVAPSLFVIEQVIRISIARNGLNAVEAIAAALAGIIVALWVGLYAQLYEFWLADRDSVHHPVFLVVPINRIPGLGHLFHGYFQARIPGKDYFALAHDLLRDHLFSRFGPGFVFRDAKTGHLTVYAGHLFAFVLASFSFGFWVVIGWSKEWRLGGDHVLIPSLAFVLSAILVITWSLSATAFLLDRLRIPVLTTVFVLSFVLGGVPASDHVFITHSNLKAPKAATPRHVLAKRSEQGIPILIATAGGGIQAAVWTTKTVEVLDQELANAGGITNRLAAISSVSGGSLGSLYLGDAMNMNASKPEYGVAFGQSLESSLDDVAWGWVFPDLIRGIQPFFHPEGYKDRGWALEHSWRKRLRNGKTTLADWTSATAADQLPAFLFNVSVVERGSPLVFSTSDFPAEPGNIWAHRRGLRGFSEIYPGRTAGVDTIARLSASFPFVAPAARADTGNADHLVDGGYYDNFGILALLDWLEQALSVDTGSEVLPKKIAIVLLRPFPDRPPQPSGPRGWNFQGYAPLLGLYNVRSNEQLKEDLDRLRQFQRAFPLLEFGVFDFQYPVDAKLLDGKSCTGQPLSWRMTKLQSECMQGIWDGIRADRNQPRAVVEPWFPNPGATSRMADVKKQVHRLKCFVNPTPGPECPK